jgi:hypothetical protein
MKRFIGGAFALALIATLAPTPAAASNPEDTDGIEIYVVNSHTVQVRAFAEDIDGRLHSLGVIARGDVATLEVPADVAEAEYRLKFVPAPVDVWSPVSDRAAILTNPISRDRVSQVTVWIEASLERSGVEFTTVADD